MTEPTQEQIKEFWEGYGWRDYYPLGFRNGWADPDGNFLPNLPPIDLNSLFQHTDPILDKMGEHYIILQKKWNDYSVKQAIIAFVNIAKYPDEFNGEGSTYEDALFWALYPILKEDKG